MAATLTIPTIFKAVDKFSTVLANMGRGVKNFTSNSAAHFQRFNQKFNNFFRLGAIQKQLLSYASTAALVGAIVSGVMFSSKSLIDYEKNVAGVHGILNDLTDSGFKPFQKQIDLVANQMRYSSVDVASSFQKIAELNISLAKTPESLGAVSKSAITLSRAADMELTPATESLVGIMAQFKLEGKDSNRVINTLAAGLKYGSATILDQAEAYRNWGTVAHAANLTIEQSTALVQTLGKYQLKGADAGTALRGTVIRLQKAHLGYASGLFNVNDALAEANKHYNKLAKARDKDNYLIKLFGIRQITAGRILLENTSLIADLTKQVTGSNQAFAQAAIKTDTLAGSWDRLKAQFVNYLTGSDKAKAGLVQLKNILNWVTDNMDSLISGVISAVKWFAIFKTSMFLISGALKLYNLYTTASIALGVTATATTAAQTVVVGGFGTAIAGVTAELGLANVAAGGFFALLSGFIVPAGILALAGLALYKVFEGDPHKHVDPNKKTFFNPKTAEGKVSPFRNTTEEASYQKWWLTNANKGADRNTLSRVNFDKSHGAEFSSKIDLSKVNQQQQTPAISALPFMRHGKLDESATAAQNATVHIVLHDAAGNVKDTHVKATGGMNVTISTTKGVR